MDIKDKMREVVRYYERNRQEGHTTVIKKIAKAEDAVILARDLIHKRTLQDHPQNRDLVIRTIDGIQTHRGPMILDNATIYSFFSEAISRIETLEAELEKGKGEK